MKRSFLLAAASVAPLLLLAAGRAEAQDTIGTAVNTPVATATANNGSPEDILINASGSVGILTPGVAVTLNSNNMVTNQGEIGFTAVNNAIGIQVLGGNTGTVTNSGTILVTDNYTPTTDTNTGLLEPPFAQGNNRTGIQVIGPGTFTGSIFNFGSVTVHGDNSFGVDIEAPITGDFQSLQFTAATTTTDATILSGTITVLGGEPPLAGAAATPPVIGFHVGATGSIGGNLTLGAISATGFGAQAVNLQGSVGGAINFMGAITSTGYESTTRTSFPTVAADYTALELEQGGVAVTIGGNVGAGVVISAPPLTAITDASTLNDTINGVSVPQTLQSVGTITSFGAAPAVVIGSATNTVEVGVVNTNNNTVLNALGANNTLMPYGLVNNGSIIGDGVFDQVNYPFLPAPVSATALQVGSTAGLMAKIDGGIYNSGIIEAEAFQASATAIHFTSGGATPTIVNDGQISASSIQESTTPTANSTVEVSSVNAAGKVTTVSQNLVPVNVYGILIDPGATVSSIINNSAITANLTGEGGPGGTVGAIIDKSGSLTSITNTGSISAQATQTLITMPMPVIATAIDISASTARQSITQSLNASVQGATAYNSTISYNQGQIVSLNGLVYQAVEAAGVAIDPVDDPSFWKEIGAVQPFISGSILFGSGGSTLTVNSGTVAGAIINLGTGSNNSLTVAGPSGSGISGAIVEAAIEEVTSPVAESQVNGNGSVLPTGGGNFTATISVNNGTLIDLNPNFEKVSSVNVGANGLLLVSADPVNGTHTEFMTTGASSFAQGAQIGISLLSVLKVPQITYTILQTVGSGTLTAGTFGQGVIGGTPWLYTATPSFVPANGSTGASLQLTVAQKTDAQLGFDAAEGAALNAILAAAPANAGVQSALLSQTTEVGLKSVYNQLLPNQGEGLFDALDAASQAVGSMIGTNPDAASRVAGTSLWLQEVNERVDRSGTQSLGSATSLFGIVAGYELMGSGGGAAGLTLAYMNANEQDDADQIGGGEVASTVELGAYYRRSIGRFTFAARAAIGYASFSDERVFAALGTTTATNASSASGTELSASSHWSGLYYDGHFSATYEQPLGHFYARPEVSADFFELDEGSHSDSGGGPAFDLNVAARDSNRLSSQAILVLGRQWGQATWLRAEVRGGYREVLSGNVGDTVASFNGGNPFSLAPDNETGGWFTAGFSIKGGSAYSYLALETDVDLRAGEQEFDVRIAGRSIF
jgi:hypothetical protein